MTDPRLRAEWDRLDAALWARGLPAVTLCWADLSDGVAGVTERRPDGLTVSVSRRLASVGVGALAVRDVLIHEAVHVAVNGELREHGARYSAEADRVAHLLGWPQPTDLAGWPTSARPYVYRSRGDWHRYP